jgi:3-dehydroquinate dehydratase/shikimate dehydrogenase
MGEKGLPARLLAGKAQAFGTFCALDQSSATAPGQPLVAEAVGRYRILRQTPATQVLGVIGYPVGHSRGPALFNDQFAANGRDAVYVPFLVETAEELSDFLRACASSSWLGVRGFSVTLPHKEAALAWAGAKAEPLAARIGAVNTIRFNHGEMDAFNTDYVGILNTLRDRCELNGRSVAVLGAGGVARAAVAGLSDGGAVITIYNRASDRAHALAEEFGCNFAPWESRADLVADVVVNCTSLGMAPAVDETPLPASAFRTGMVVLDTVYTPAETRFVREAKAAGCIEVRGVEVFIQQAARQHELWFEEPLNVTRARQVLGVG